MSEVKHTPSLRSSKMNGRISEADFGPCVAQVFVVDDRPPSDFLGRLALFTAAPDLLEAVLTALPYVECAEADAGYKPGAVKRVSAQMRAALIAAGVNCDPRATEARS